MASIASSLAAIVMALGALAPDDTDRTSNAAVHYRRAIAVLPKFGLDEQAIIDDQQIDPLSSASRGLLGKSAVVLREVQAGARIQRCDWGAWSEEELNCSRDRFLPTSQVGRLVCLNARAAFEHRQFKIALGELAAALKLADDSGRQGPWIAKLVQISLELRVIDVLELHLPRLDREEKLVVEAWLRSRPVRGRLDEATKGEKSFMQYRTDQLGKLTDQQAYDELKKAAFGPEEIDEADATWQAAGRSAAGLVKFYARSIVLLGELDKILAMPSDQAALAFAAHRKRYKALNPPTCSASKTLEKIRGADDRVRCRVELLQAATAILLRGPEALGDLKDPFGRRVIFEPKNRGFELRTETTHDGKPIAAITILDSTTKKDP